MAWKFCFLRYKITDASNELKLIELVDEKLPKEKLFEGIRGFIDLYSLYSTRAPLKQQRVAFCFSSSNSMVLLSF